MICADCGTSNQEQSRFCSSCGKPLLSQDINNNNPPQLPPIQGPVVGMRPLFSKEPLPPPSGYSPSQQSPKNGVTNQPSQQLAPSNENVVMGFRQIQGNPSSVQPNENNSKKNIPSKLPPELNVKTPQQDGICPVCQNENPIGAILCGVCGNKLENISNNGQAQQGTACPNCRTINSPRAKFCKSCGQPLTSTGFRPPSNSYLHTNTRSISTVNTKKLWIIVAGLGAIFAFICFFLPNIIIKIANPMSWFTDGPENITISMSAMQVLTQSSPNIKGLGQGLEGLGEFSQNFYDEIDMGQIMFNAVDPATQRSITINRIFLGLLLCCTLASIIVTILATKTSSKEMSYLIIVLGGISIVILLISTFIGNASFKTGNTDADLLLDSAISFSNGIGFWGMLVGFISFGFGGYLRNH